MLHLNYVITNFVKTVRLSVEDPYTICTSLSARRWYMQESVTFTQRTFCARPDPMEIGNRTGIKKPASDPGYQTHSFRIPPLLKTELKKFVEFLSVIIFYLMFIKIVYLNISIWNSGFIFEYNFSGILDLCFKKTAKIRVKYLNTSKFFTWCPFIEILDKNWNL